MVQYIVYDREQREVRYSDGTVNGPGINNPFYIFEEPSEFRPTWLVRVYDMQVVPGSSVNDHYWALSYSWNNSGDVVLNHRNGEYERSDQCKHQIVSYKRSIVTAKTKFSSRLWKYGRYQREYQKTSKVVNVNFERIIQRICKDFNINYIWYDQLCIDQNNHNAKLQEIRQMHLIYKNARCTLALIPELEVTAALGYHANVDVITESDWSKRIWTLEEAYMSRSILFVGRNVHIWSKQVTTVFSSKSKVFLENIKLKNGRRKWKACTALWFARTRTSSKAHDRIFALLNIFPELQDRITFSYRQPLLDLMLKFYSLLAGNDISVLLFGAPIDTDANTAEHKKLMETRRKEAILLPSWTGARGAHIPQNQFESANATEKFRWTVTANSMQLSSRFILVRIETADSVEKPDSPLRSPILSAFYTEDGLPRRFGGGKCVVDYGAMWCLTFVTTTSKSEDDYNRRTKEYGLRATHFLPLREEDEEDINTLSKPNLNGGFLSLTEECLDCIILTDLHFLSESYRCHPVLKRDKSYFRSVGVCFLEKDLNCTLLGNPEQTFLIK